MQFTKNIFLAAIAFANYAIATPVAVADSAAVSPNPHIVFNGDVVSFVEDDAAPELVARQSKSATVTAWSSDTCGGSSVKASVINQGDRCVAVTNKRSITHSGYGCTVRSWSGNNCRGSHADIPQNGCNSLLFASFSIKC